MWCCMNFLVIWLVVGGMMGRCRLIFKCCEICLNFLRWLLIVCSIFFFCKELRFMVVMLFLWLCLLKSVGYGMIILIFIGCKKIIFGIRRLVNCGIGLFYVCNLFLEKWLKGILIVCLCFVFMWFWKRRWVEIFFIWGVFYIFLKLLILSCWLKCLNGL